MNIKIFDIILKYGTVLLCCVILGATARIIFMKSGGDDYTGNIVFWTVTSVLFILYLGIVFILHEILDKVNKKKPTEKRAVKNEPFLQNKSSESQIISEYEGFSNQQETKDKKIILKPIESSYSEEVPKIKEPSKNSNIDIEEIRNEKIQELSRVAEEKNNIALNYTRREFALYVSEEDLVRLCESVLIYSNDDDFKNLKSVSVHKLTNLDLYHFGWNIWNHFRSRDQKETATFLKTVFKESLNDIEEESIKKHLKDDERKGIIKIKKNLFQERNNQ